MTFISMNDSPSPAAGYTPMKVVFKLSPPGAQLMAGGTLEHPNGSIYHLEGSGVPIIWELQDFLNLTLESYLTPDWTEAWNVVADGKVELGAPLFTSTFRAIDERSMNTVQLLHPVLSTPSVVYFRQFRKSFTHNLFVGPLKFNTDALATVVTLWTLAIFMCSYLQRSTSHDGLFLWSNVLLWGASFIQGKDYPLSYREKKDGKLSLRGAMWAGTTLGIMTNTIYTAKILAFFSAPNNAIMSPEDLILNNFKLGSYSVIHFERLFQNMTNGRNDAQKAVDYFSATINDTVAKLLERRSPYAFLSHPDGFYQIGRFSGNYTSELCHISSFYAERRSSRSMYIRKGSPMKEILNWKLLQMLERGVNFRIQENYRKKYEYVCGKPKVTFTQLSIQHAIFPTLILVSGACLAIAIEICSNFHYSKIIRG